MNVVRAAIAASVLALGGVAIVVALHHSPAPALGPAPIGTHGYDVSWPQCAGGSAGHMPSGRPPYLLLGLTHGAGNTVNPCLGSQLNWAKSRGIRVGAYLVASYPSKAQRALASTGIFGVCKTATRCELRNNGAAQAQTAISTLHTAGLAVPMVWIDVEVSKVLPWSRRVKRNIALLHGVIAGMRAAHLPVGIYTTSAMWQQITGGYRLKVPNWLPSGDGKPHHAARLCPTTATGGVTWLVQYTRSLDEDLTCPVLAAVRGTPGPLWQFRTTRLQLGSQGAAVSAMQQVVGTPVTGTYDAITAGAVRTWQAAHRLQVTGTIASADWQAMGAFQTRGGHAFWLSRVVSPTESAPPS